MSTSSAKEWREKAIVTKDITLPSGVTVTVKRISIFDLALAGHIPAGFMEMIINKEKTKTGSKSKEENMLDILKSQEDIVSIGKMAREITIAAVVSPKVSREENVTDKNTISIYDIPGEDQMDIFTKVMSFADDITEGEKASLANFPDK